MQAVKTIFEKLYRCFGPQYWWPGDSPFEVAVGAILTQNTNWGNVEKAILNLKRHGLLSPRGMHRLSVCELASLIRPSGYHNLKARRLRSFLDFLMNEYQGMIQNMSQEDIAHLRPRLLRIQGIGPETADSILLYALEKPVFVIDAYTKRVLSRHGIMSADSSYDEFQELFHSSMEKEADRYNEYHALLVRVGKEFCGKKIARCGQCPLGDMLSAVYPERARLP